MNCHHAFVGAGTAGHCTRFLCKRLVSCANLVGIAAGISAEQRESGKLDILLWLPRLGPNGQVELLGVYEGLGS